MKTLLSLTSFLLLLALPVSATSEDRAESHLSFARSLLGDGEYYRAITEFKRTLFYADSLSYSLQAAAVLGIGEALYSGLEFERSGEWLNRHLRNLKEWGHGNEGSQMMCRAFLAADAGARLIQVLDGKAVEQPLLGYYRPLALANVGEWDDSHEGFLTVPQQSSYYSLAQEQSAIALKGVNASWKSPATAGWLGVVPGLGYFYSGHNQTGVASFIVNSVFMFATYQAFDADQNVLGGFLAVVTASWYAGNIYGSVVAARRHNHHLQREIFSEFNY